MKTKTTSPFIVIICFLVFTAIASASTQLGQGFENMPFTNGTSVDNSPAIGNFSDTGGAWRTNNPNDIDQATLPKITSDEHYLGKQSLQITRTKDKSGKQINLELYGSNRSAPKASTLSGAVVTRFYVYMTKGATLEFSTGIGFGSANPGVKILGNGNLYGYNFTGKKRSTIQFKRLKTGLKQDQWYGIKIKTDLSNKTYKVYLDSGNGFKELNSSALSAPGLSGSISQTVSFKPKGIYGSSFYVDDIHIDTQTKAEKTIVAVAEGKLLQLSSASTPYVIALADNAIPAEKTAAQQLQKYLYEMTGATFPVKNASSVSEDAKQILVGPGQRVKALLPKMDWKKLGHDGIVIKTVGNKLIIAGGRPRGTIYAAFEFLKSLGCRWWTPTAFTIPQKSSLIIKPQNVVYIPPFSKRAHSGLAQGHPKFATILHENGYYYKQSSAWGGHLKQLRCSFAGMLPPKKYFKQHPQWYTDPLNGNRPSTSETKMPTSSKQWQIDTTNPQVIEEYSKQVIKYIKDHPGGNALAVWFNDNPNYSQSPGSKAVVEKYGSPSALMIQFGNQVAKRVHKVYPGFPVQVQAYWWTTKPPVGIKPGPGVVVEIAPITANYTYPIESKHNTRTYNQILGWSKVAPRLNFWYYVTDFRWRMFPFPDWNTLGKNLKFLADHHVVGMYEQGAGDGSPVAHFLKLRTWLLGQLMWNPYQDQEKLMEEFLNGYYGAAGPYLNQYIHLVQKARLKLGGKLGVYDTNFSYMTLDVANKGIQLFNHAQMAVQNNPTLLKRVKEARMTLRAVVLAKLQYYHHQAKVQHKTFLGPKNLSKTLSAFKEDAKRYGLKRFSQGTSTMLKRLERRAKNIPAGPLPGFAQGYPKGDVINFPADDIHLYAFAATKLMKDPASPTGDAATLIGQSKVPAIQVRIGPSLPAKRWHIYALARVSTTPDAKMSGAAFQGNVLNMTHSARTKVYKFPMTKVAGKQYHWLDMGEHGLNGGYEIRFAGMGRKDVKRIYVAQVVFIRAGAKKK